MDFSYSYNFNLRNTKINQQKPDTKGKDEEVKGEEQASPKTAPETVVLTGNAAEIQAAIAKALVPGAGQVTSPKGDGDGGWEGIWIGIQALEAAYAENKDNMSYEERLDALNAIINEYNSILGNDNLELPVGTYSTIHAGYIGCLQEEYATVTAFWNGEIQDANGNNCPHTISAFLLLKDIMDDILEQMHKYLSIGELPQIVLEWMSENIAVLAHEYMDALESDESNVTLSDINEYLEAIESITSEYETIMSDAHIESMMEDYLNASIHANNVMQGNMAPTPGNSVAQNAAHLLGIVETNNPNYEFVFTHQSDFANYRYFQAQINQNQVFLNALRNYKDMLSRGVQAPPDIIQELNHEIERYEALLASARDYLRQIPTSIGFYNANVPADQ